MPKTSRTPIDWRTRIWPPDVDALCFGRHTREVLPDGTLGKFYWRFNYRGHDGRRTEVICAPGVGLEHAVDAVLDRSLDSAFAEYQVQILSVAEVAA